LSARQIATGERRTTVRSGPLALADIRSAASHFQSRSPALGTSSSRSPPLAI